jgi:hypothetical protein
MQKVVGSNPIIRSLETAATAAVFVFERALHEWSNDDGLGYLNG